MRKSLCTVREVEQQDLDALAALEVRVWQGTDVSPLSREELQRWYAMRSPFFLLAERDGEIGGHYFGQLNNFDFSMIDEYTKLDSQTGRGYTKHMHDPRGNSVYGIAVTSLMRGAGRALNTEVYERLRRLKKDSYFGYSRLSGFDAYLKDVADPAHNDLIARCGGLMPVALWYAHESMRLIGGKIWQEYCTPQPSLALPSPTRPDPVLSFHAKGTGFGLLRIVPGFMRDEASRGFGAFLAYQSHDS